MKKKKNQEQGELCTSVPQLFKCFPDCLLVQYLQKWDDKRSEWEVGRFLQFGVEFLNG